MANKNKKVAVLHITKNDIRMVEGRIGEGQIIISKAATIPNINRFYQGDRLVYLSEMVSAVMDAMTTNSFTSKEIRIVYDNNLLVEFFLDNKINGPKKSAMDGLKSIGKKGGDKKPTAPKNSALVVHRTSWGVFITESEQGEMFTTTTMERDFMLFMVSEFKKYGIKVISMEAPETALIYMRNLVPFSYDAINKIVVHADNDEQGKIYQFTKDIPTTQRTFLFAVANGDTLAERIVDTIKDEMWRGHIANPYVVLMGDVFKDVNILLEVYLALKAENINCIDTYNVWRDNATQYNGYHVVTGDNKNEIALDGSYGICVAMIVRGLEKKPENMIEGVSFSFISKKTRSTIATVFLCGAVIFTGVSGTLAYFSYRNLENTKVTYQTEATYTKNMVSRAERERDKAITNLQTLDTIDDRYAAVMKFIHAELSEDLNIVSVDTVDMIAMDSNSGSAFSQPTTGLEKEEETESTDSQAASQGGQAEAPAQDPNAIPPYEKQSIIIRGYARTTDGPVDLFGDLVNAGFTEVKIIGIQQVPVPDGNRMFAFELLVGGGN